MIKDELEAMLTEELSLAEIARRLNVTPTSVIRYLYDLHKQGIIIMRWKQLDGRATRTYKLRLGPQEIDDI